MIELGDKVKDTVSGFIGIVISATTYLNGCRWLCVQPPVKKTGDFREPIYFDEAQLRKVTQRATPKKPVKRSFGGGGNHPPIPGPGHPPLRHREPGI